MILSSSIFTLKKLNQEGLNVLHIFIMKSTYATVASNSAINHSFMTTFTPRMHLCSNRISTPGNALSIKRCFHNSSKCLNYPFNPSSSSSSHSDNSTSRFYPIPSQHTYPLRKPRSSLKVKNPKPGHKLIDYVNIELDTDEPILSQPKIHRNHGSTFDVYNSKYVPSILKNSTEQQPLTPIIESPESDQEKTLRLDKDVKDILAKSQAKKQDAFKTKSQSKYIVVDNLEKVTILALRLYHVKKGLCTMNQVQKLSQDLFTNMMTSQEDVERELVEITDIDHDQLSRVHAQEKRRQQESKLPEIAKSEIETLLNKSVPKSVEQSRYSKLLRFLELEGYSKNDLNRWIECILAPSLSKAFVSMEIQSPDTNKKTNIDDSVQFHKWPTFLILYTLRRPAMSRLDTLKLLVLYMRYFKDLDKISQQKFVVKMIQHTSNYIPDLLPEVCRIFVSCAHPDLFKTNFLCNQLLWQLCGFGKIFPNMRSPAKSRGKLDGSNKTMHSRAIDFIIESQRLLVDEMKSRNLLIDTKGLLSLSHSLMHVSSEQSRVFLKYIDNHDYDYSSLEKVSLSGNFLSRRDQQNQEDSKDENLNKSSGSHSMKQNSILTNLQDHIAKDGFELGSTDKNTTIDKISHIDNSNEVLQSNNTTSSKPILDSRKTAESHLGNESVNLNAPKSTNAYDKQNARLKEHKAGVFPYLQGPTCIDIMLSQNGDQALHALDSGIYKGRQKMLKFQKSTTDLSVDKTEAESKSKESQADLYKYDFGKSSILWATLLRQLSRLNELTPAITRVILSRIEKEGVNMTTYLLSQLATGLSSSYTNSPLSTSHHEQEEEEPEIVEDSSANISGDMPYYSENSYNQIRTTNKTNILQNINVLNQLLLKKHPGLMSQSLAAKYLRILATKDTPTIRDRHAHQSHLVGNRSVIPTNVTKTHVSGLSFAREIISNLAKPLPLVMYNSLLHAELLHSPANMWRTYNQMLDQDGEPDNLTLRYMCRAAWDIKLIWTDEYAPGKMPSWWKKEGESDHSQPTKVSLYAAQRMVVEFKHWVRGAHVDGGDVYDYLKIYPTHETMYAYVLMLGRAGYTDDLLEVLPWMARIGMIPDKMILCALVTFSPNGSYLLKHGQVVNKSRQAYNKDGSSTVDQDDSGLMDWPTQEEVKQYKDNLYYYLKKKDIL